MALDQNLFTLNLNRSSEDASSIQLVDPQGTAHYSKRRMPVEGSEQAFGVFEPHSDSLLATVRESTSKLKLIELYNPSVIIELKSVGTLTFRWSFSWEEHTFEWKREECFMIRKPDPPVLVAITREPPGKIRSSMVQIMDYNLHRFDVNDRKGLEITILAALLSFQDNAEEQAQPSTSRRPSATIVVPKPINSTPPPIPPKEQRYEEDQIAILQAKEARDANEVVVGDVGDIETYAKSCAELLKDPSILFVAIRSHRPENVPKVVSVADATKRLVYREELLPEIEDLHQYVSYNEKTEQNVKKKKVIKLDELTDKDGAAAYKPPEALTVRLSKIPMPELVPKAPPGVHPSSSHTQSLTPVSSQNKTSKHKEQKEKPSKHDKKKHGGSLDTKQEHDRFPSKPPAKLNKSSRYSPPPSQSPSAFSPPPRPPPIHQSPMARPSFQAPPHFSGALNTNHHPSVSPSPHAHTSEPPTLSAFLGSAALSMLNNLKEKGVKR